MRTKDQERATLAHSLVSSLAGTEPNRLRKGYGALCLRTPALIQSSGLCQAISFYEAKAKGKDAAESEHALYLKHLGKMVFPTNNDEFKMLPRKARELDLQDYLQLSREALQCALWMKRYAEAVLKVSSDEEVAQQ